MRVQQMSKLFKKFLSISVFSFLLVLSVHFSLAIADELPLKKFDVVNYSPYRDGQGPGWRSDPNEFQIREDIKLIKPITNEIRIYGMGKLSSRLMAAPKRYENGHAPKA